MAVASPGDDAAAGGFPSGAFGGSGGASVGGPGGHNTKPAGMSGGGPGGSKYLRRMALHALPGHKAMPRPGIAAW